MKKIILTIFITLCALSSWASEVTREYGVETTPSDYIQNIYLYNNLVHYLDQGDLHITYQAETTGEYNQPDRLIFSVEGSSFRWNRYYLDGFRVDSRFFAGSSLYMPDMSQYDLSLDYISSRLNFSSLESREENLSLSYNVGGVGGISVGTAQIQRLLHATASDRAYKPIEDRNQIKGAGTAKLNFALRDSEGEEYMQSIYMNFGERWITGFDNTGISEYYPERYGQFQLGGEAPLTLGGLFDQGGYILNYAERDHLNSEFYYSREESSALKSYGASIYGQKRADGLNYTSGFNFALNDTEHENLNYSRNLIDHDGEGFDPWQPDGATYELSYSLTLDKRVNDWLNLSFDGYNSLLRFNPSSRSFSNTTYAQLTEQEDPTMLYLYEWRSSDFTSALLENSVSLNTERELTPNLNLYASVGVTLDAMIVGGNSIVSPNIEARASLRYRPTEWLDLGLNLSRERVSYNINDIQFLSADYLSGEVYYIDQSGEKGGLFTTTGGEYHTLSDEARQPNYYVFDIPINLTFGRHHITLLHSYRKYNNSWTVGYDGDASDYGYTVPISTREGDTGAFFLNGGQQVNYVVGSYPEGIMGDNPFTSTPFYLCSNIEYSYISPKLTLSINWQSYMMSGVSTLGSGPLHNNIGALSESSANPNTTNVVGNSDSPYQAVGRLDQDRAYIARIFASYQITPQWGVALNAKFKDGQPFSIYHAEVETSGGGNQLAILPMTSRGTNTADGNFGTREDGIYNIDLRVNYRTTIAKRNCEFGLYCYNAYDFGNELTEYIFDQDIDGGRHAMSITIPRGFIFSFKMDL